MPNPTSNSGIRDNHQRGAVADFLKARTQSGSRLIAVRGTAVSMVTGKDGDDISLTDIAFEFASWVSVESKLYLIKEFQFLKDEENDRLQLGWNHPRTLATLRDPARAGLPKLLGGELSVEQTTERLSAR